MQEQILREWRGIDEATNLNRGLSRPQDHIKGILKRLGLGDGITEQEVKAAWREIAGENIALHSQPASVKNGHLVLHVTQPLMRFHLEQMKPMLLKRVRAHFGEDRIRSIQFSLG